MTPIQTLTRGTGLLPTPCDAVQRQGSVFWQCIQPITQQVVVYRIGAAKFSDLAGSTVRLGYSTVSARPCPIVLQT